MAKPPMEHSRAAQLRDNYIPALNQRWLTPLYDPLLRWVMCEEAFKRRLIRQAQIGPGQRVLDLGCGTATLTIWIKQSHPDAQVVGLDGDPQVLDIGRAKAAQAGVDITLDSGLASDLPYADCSFDRVLSSLVMHHLTHDNKLRAAQEAFRILRPGGELHVLDFGKPRGAYSRLIAPIMRTLEHAADNVEGLLPDMFRKAGFHPVEELAQAEIVFGTISLYFGRKPAKMEP
jgi:ubiquinone/menaquinone biosynthesis C-methylase UbiE